MNCAEIIPKLELMADDELSSEQAAQILCHIDDCAVCSNHWYGILSLRKAVKDRAASFRSSCDFEDRLISAIRKEAWQSKAGQRKNSLLLYAAALLVAGTAATAIYTTTLPKSSQPNSPATANNPVTTNNSAAGSTSAQQLVAQTAAGSYNPASLEDAMNNFKQYLDQAALASGAEAGSGTGAEAGAAAAVGAGATTTGPSDLLALSSQAGFAVKPLQLSGFKLSAAQLISAAPGKSNLVRLCYRRTKGKGSDSIVCYQAACGKLIAKGLNEHFIDGKKICCGEVEDKSVVFIPGQKGHINEVLLVGTISKSDLMDLVLSSS